MEEYINKLQLFCECKFDYIIDGDSLKIYVDNESYYTYNYRYHIILYYEKNNVSEIGHWNNKEVGDYYFAQMIRTAFERGVVYGDPRPYEEAKNFDELYIRMKSRFSEELFSIGKNEERKISIVKGDADSFKIKYTEKEKVFTLDESSDTEYIFGRFYNEVTYLEYFRKSMNQYNQVFGKSFSAVEEILPFRDLAIGCSDSVFS